MLGVTKQADLIHPVPPEFFRGKVGLDAGCGFGRHVVVSGLVRSPFGAHPPLLRWPGFTRLGRPCWFSERPDLGHRPLWLAPLRRAPSRERHVVFGQAAEPHKAGA